MYDESFDEVFISSLPHITELVQRAGRTHRESAKVGRTDAAVYYYTGSGKTEAYVALRKTYREARTKAAEARKLMLSASSVDELRSAAREYLAALAELFACLLRFIIAAVLLALFRSAARLPESDHSDWKPAPIDAFPRIAPRGPNFAAPVLTVRGGHSRSTPGSVVLTA
ncbi:hypothetical protein ABZ770_16090 [Streptomyces sp. NPDC006654]|uniref:hypothetical protein n=1 Tax=unclassified Streptomyces TaxID=2593676 RepID=UPI003408B69F